MDGFDWTTYFQATVAGVPVLFVVYGLVTLFGKMGLHGNKQLLASFGTGVLIGVPTMLAQVRPPAGDAYEAYVYWFGNLVYGIALGIAASLYYETQKAAQIKAINKIEEQATLGAGTEPQ